MLRKIGDKSQQLVTFEDLKSPIVDGDMITNH